MTKDNMWHYWGASACGPAHFKNGLPNQDSWLARNYKWGNLIVVADGLGSRTYSHLGSRAICLAMAHTARIFGRHPAADIKCMLRLAHTCWLMKIFPHSPEECATTCLFAVRIGPKISLGRLGDGLIIVVGNSDDRSWIMAEDKSASFANVTSSIRKEFEMNLWETASIGSDECLAIVLCTDGIADDLHPDQKLAFAQSLYTTYAGMKREKSQEDIMRWLNEWPVPGHTDDKTIACLYRDGHSL